MAFDISKFFRKGQNNTIEFRGGSNLSYAGPSATLVENGTELDRWYVGSYFGVEYTIACDVNSARKEIIKCLCTASTSTANIVIYGRSNLGNDLLQLEVEVTDSYFKLMAYPKVQEDSTSISGAKIIHSANYYATLNEPGPVIAGSSSSAYAPTYTLSRSTSLVNEGQTFSITLITTNVNAGTTIPFTITGVQSADIGGADLTGNFITGTTDTFTYPVTADLSTEGPETFTMTLDNITPSVAANVTIQDLSQTPAITYNLTSNLSNVNEGDTFRITLTTGNVDPGVTLDYTVTGVTAADLSAGNLTGSFIVGTTDYFDFTLADDTTTEGVESFNIALNNGQATAQVQIADTSQSAAVASYSLGRSVAAVNEGGSFTITLTTENVANGTSLPYTITGIQSADIGGGALTGDFIVGTTESRVFNVSSDLSTEGTETFQLALDNGEATVGVTINDTSITPGNNYTINVTNAGAGAYSLSGTDRNGAVSGNNAQINLNVNDNLTLSMNASGHPLFIKTTNSTGTSYQVTNPVAGGQGNVTGSITWTPSAAGTYHYNCQYHSAMHGLIVVT
jgi:plastocyanin